MIPQSFRSRAWNRSAHVRIGNGREEEGKRKGTENSIGSSQASIVQYVTRGARSVDVCEVDHA